MEKLIKIQNELKVPKGNLNKFGNYKYRSAEDILEAVKPLLLKHSAMLTLTDEIVSIGGKNYLKAVAIFTVDEKSIHANGFAETSEHKGMSAEQTTGTASSYARKYALNGLFLIDETQSDPDSQKPAEQKPLPPAVVTPPKAMMTEQQATDILKACTSLPVLATTYKSLSFEMQKKMEFLKNELKEQLQSFVK